MASLPEGYIRADQIIGSPKKNITARWPVAPSTFWLAVKQGRFPQPVRFGPKTTLWKVEEVRQFLNNPAEWASQSKSS